MNFRNGRIFLVTGTIAFVSLIILITAEPVPSNPTEGSNEDKFQSIEVDRKIILHKQFIDSKPKILSEIEQFLEDDMTKEALALSSKYEFTDDLDLLKLHILANTAHMMSQRDTRTSKLIQKIEATSSTDTRKLVLLYSELVLLNPNNQEYSDALRSIKSRSPEFNLDRASVVWHAVNTYGWNCSKVVSSEQVVTENYYFITCDSGLRLRVYPRLEKHPKITNEQGTYSNLD